MTGFHEAVGDTISLSVCTPQHLSKVGLIDKIEDNKGFKYVHFSRLMSFIH